MANILALAGLLSLVVMATEGCQCYAPLHPQDAVCNAPLMVRATVEEWKPLSYNKDGVLVEWDSRKSDIDRERYELQIHEIYRNDGTIDTDTGPFYLYFFANFGMCGVPLDENVEYVISMHLSSYDPKQPTANFCSSYIRRWVDLEEEIRKKFINQVYVDACKECKVKMCPYGCHDQKNDTCVYTRDIPHQWNRESCLRQGLCVRQETGECAWNFKKCGIAELYPAQSIEYYDDDSTGTEVENVDTPPDVVGEEPDTVFSDEADITP